jgi:4-amino-4-deoxy-L-arabinose transferase-like glycosyltransferase
MNIYKNNINKIFYIFLIIHLIVWTLIPTFTNHNLPLDTIEALAWGSNLDWGFNKHPPASAFFVEVFYNIFGNKDWAYYFLSQIFVIFSFFIVWKFSYDLLSDKYFALLSVLLLEAIYYFNFTSPEFNVNICQLPFWSLTVYYSWKIYSKKKIELKECLLLGIFAGIGFLSKYLFIYLLISIKFLFLYSIFIKKDMKYQPKYLLPSIVFLIILIPHLIWLMNNDYITLTYGIHRTGLNELSITDHFKYPIIFVGKQIGILIPFFILIFLLISKFKFNLKFNDKKLLFLLGINLLPIIFIFLTSLILGAKIRTMWMTPFYLFMGTLFIYIFQNQINTKRIKNFYKVLIFLFLLSPISYAYISIDQTNKRTDYPGKEIANKVQEKWSQEFSLPINVVLGDEWNAGNLSYHLKSRPIWEGELEKSKLDSYNMFICIDDICVGNK